MKYKYPHETAKSILSAIGVEKEEHGYYLILRGRLDYYEMTDENMETLIDEVLDEHAIDWFDESMTSGTIEINGTEIKIEINESQATIDD